MPHWGRVHSELDPSLCLSNRQAGIVDCLSGGLQPKQIASLVHRSYHTLVEHINRAARALGAHTKAELVALAIQHGFVVLPPPPRLGIDPEPPPAKEL